MAANIDFIPRLDAQARAGIIDTSKLGEAHRDSAGNISFSKLGTEIGRNTPTAKRSISAAVARAWVGAPQQRIDAATDFLTSGLTLQGGQGEMIIRPPDPTLFVPGPGRTQVIPSRNVLKPGYRKNTYPIRQRKAQAEWVDPSAMRQLNRASYQDELEERGAEYYAIAYGYSLPGTWESEILGTDELAENTASATEGLDDFRERVSLWGDAGKKLSGFATLGDAALLLGGQQFSSMVPTAVQMMQRIAAFEQRYVRMNKGRKPSACLIPDSDRLAMQNTWFGAGGEGPSVWDRALEQYPWMKNASFSESLLLGNEAGTASRWVLYTQDPMALYVEHMETMLFGPFQDYLTFTFVALRRHGGVINKIPERVCYVDFTA